MNESETVLRDSRQPWAMICDVTSYQHELRHGNKTNVLIKVRHTQRIHLSTMDVENTLYTTFPLYYSLAITIQNILVMWL